MFKKSYKLVAIEKNANIFECNTCKTRSRVPKRQSKLKATCPGCGHVHTIEPKIEKNSFDWTAFSKRVERNIKRAPAWSFYIALFVLILLFQVISNI